MRVSAGSSLPAIIGVLQTFPSVCALRPSQHSPLLQGLQGGDYCAVPVLVIPNSFSLSAVLPALRYCLTRGLIGSPILGWILLSPSCLYKPGNLVVIQPFTL